MSVLLPQGVVNVAGPVLIGAVFQGSESQAGAAAEYFLLPSGVVKGSAIVLTIDGVLNPSGGGAGGGDIVYNITDTLTLNGGIESFDEIEFNMADTLTVYTDNTGSKTRYRPIRRIDFKARYPRVNFRGR